MIEKIENGYITIFMALSLGIILSLCFALIEGARNNGSRMLGECAFEIGMNSILAEYHRELLNQYDVFFIDTSYGTAIPSYEETAEHLTKYINGNLSCNDINAFINYQDMFGLSVQNIQVGELSLATDDGGKVFRLQAEEYIKEKYGLGIIEDTANLLKVVDDNNLTDTSITSRRTSVESRIDDIDGSEIQVGEDEWVTVEVDNPADYMNTVRNKGILSLVIPDKAISSQGFSINGSLYSRKKNTGIGVNPEKDGQENQIEKLLFDEYIMDKYSFWGQELDKSFMKYQVEYILEGKDNDTDNLKAVAGKLIAMRETANVAYLFADSSKRAKAQAMAATVSAVLTIPELQILLEYAILFAWAYAESIYDVKTLFAGGKIPLVKTATSWHTDIDSILGGAVDGEADERGEGQSYKDYLRILLALENMEKKTMRSLDMLEWDIRKTPGNENFRIDGCLDSLVSEVNIVSRFGYSFFIRRRCCYG